MALPAAMQRWADALRRRRVKASAAVRSVVKAASRLRARFARTVSRLSAAVWSLSVLASVVCLVVLVLLVGFDHPADEVRALWRVVRGCQWVMLTAIVWGFVVGRRRRSGRGRRGRALRLVLQLLVLLTAIPLIYHQPERPWVGWLAEIVYSRLYLVTALGIYSITEISAALLRLSGRRTNPSLVLMLSFLSIIFIGTLLLLMPKATYSGISVDDALFVSTSAVCITGLTPVDVPATFTPLGTLILGLLIQVGGLGVLTFTYFFALFFSGSQSILTQMIVRDVVWSRTMSGLLPTMLYILSVTLVVEAAGAVGLYFSLPEGLVAGDAADRVWVAVFHSVSAFCNAGFSTIPGGYSNVMLMWGNQAIYWVTAAIVVAGSLGFPLLVNIKDAVLGWLHGRRRRPHVFDMNSKIVAVTFTALFVAGAAGFLVMEWDNTLVGMSVWDKISQAVFNSTTPRSSGFVSVDPARFLAPTLLMVMVLMWVGGAAQSTGGGIKVNTLGTVILHLRAIVQGRASASAFGRRISLLSIRRANAVVVVSVLAYSAYALAMLLLEPRLPARDVLFETASALFTVGSSLGVTAELSAVSKVLLSTAMLLGRVGIISIFMGMTRRRAHDPSLMLPTENVIIN